MKFLDAIKLNPTISIPKEKPCPFISMENVDFHSREPLAYEMKAFSSGVKFEDGDTVIARITPCLQNGKSFYCKDIGQGFGSTEFLVFRPQNKAVDNSFLYYYLSTFNVRQRMINSMVGATGRQRVNNDVFKSMDVDFPDITIQRRIADILSAYDDLIENNRKQIKLLEEAAQRLYKEWFVDLRFPGHEKVKVTDGVPEGWERKALSEIANVIMGTSPKSEFYNIIGDGLPFQQGVGSFGDRFVEDTIYSSSLTKIADAGSILFSVRAPVGRINLTRNKVIIGRGLAAINHKKGSQSYLFYLLKERFFCDDIVGNGSIFASINKEDLSTEKLLVADDNIVCLFENLVQSIDSDILCLFEQIKLLQEARDRLLPKLMNGEIEV